MVTFAFVVLVVNMWWTRRAPTAPVALIVAGGIANVVDRLEAGSVVDMLHTGWWPTFNLADVAIVCGAAALVLTTLRAPAEQASES